MRIALMILALVMAVCIGVSVGVTGTALLVMRYLRICAKLRSITIDDVEYTLDDTDWFLYQYRQSGEV